MKICFPARKANGEQYATLDEMMQPLCQEPHGSWLAGTNNMWHGGIHITSKSAPGSVLTNETADTAVPLQFMAGKGIITKSSRRTFACGCQSSAGDASEATDCPLCRNKTGCIKIKKIFEAQVSS